MSEIIARDATTGPEPPRGRAAAARRARWIVAALLAAVLASALWVMLTGSPSGTAARPVRSVRLLTLDRPFPVGGTISVGPLHRPSGLRGMPPRRVGPPWPVRSCPHLAAGRRALARSLDGTTIADPDHPDVRWSYRYGDGRLHIRRTAGADVEEYAFTGRG